jgi:hypothetical protein
MTPGKAVALSASVLVIVAAGVLIVGAQGTLNLYGLGRAQHAIELVQQRVGAPLVVQNVEVTPQILTVVAPDPGGSSAPTVWTVKRRSLFGWTEWDDVTGPTKKYDIPISDNLLQTPFKLELNDVANVHNLAEAAIARAGFGEGSAVTDVILTEAPQFIHPEEPRWTVRVARQSQSAEIFADRAGTLFPAPAPRAGAPRIVIHATANTWIRVRDADQSVLFDDVLHSGDSYSVPNAPGLSLRTGNAGGLEITIDGKPTPPIGGYMTRRDVALGPDALLAGTAIQQ